MSTDSYVEMRRLWHPLPEGHAVPKPADAIMMREFFRQPSMYPTTKGKIKGHSWTPFCRGNGGPPVIISEFAEAPDGLTVPYDYKDDPESFVPNEKDQGYLVQMRFGEEALAITRNFMAMLKQFLLDAFPTMAPEKLLKKFPTREDQVKYFDSRWKGWAGTYENFEGEVRDAYGKVKTLQVVRDQSKRRYPREATEFIRVTEVCRPDGTVETKVDDTPIDHTAVTRGARVKAMSYIDWVAFTEGERRGEQGDILVSFTAMAMLVVPFAEAASVRDPATLAKLGLTSASAPDPTAPPPAATDIPPKRASPPPAATDAPPMHASPASAAPEAMLPMPPSVGESPTPSKRAPRELPDADSPARRMRTE